MYNIHEGGFTIYRLKLQFARFVIPSILSMWVYSIYTMVDGFFVAKFINEQALASVNLSIPFVSSLLALSILFAVGTQTLLGILIGKGEKERANQLFTFINLSFFVFTVLAGIFCYLFVSQISKFLSTDVQTQEYVREYLRIIILFSPCFIFAYHFEVLAKVDGFPTLTIICSVASAFLNVVLDYLFVAVFSYGIQGAAVATGIAQMMSAVIYFIHFLRHPGNLKFVPFQPKFSIYKKIIQLGFGDFLSELSGGVIVFLYNYFLLKKIGFRSVITFSVINYYSLIVGVTMQGISQGIQPLVSFHRGKNDGKEKKLFRYAIFSVFIASSIFYAIGNIFSEQVFGLFLGKDVLPQDIAAFRQFSIYYLILGYNLISIGYLAAVGKPKYAMYISSLRGMIVIAIILFAIPKQWLWLSSFITELIILMITWILFKKSSFEKI